MKKWILFVMLMAVLLSCCACGQETATVEGSAPETEQTQPAQDTATEPTELDIYASMDETVPVDGVYKIHSVVGLQNMANHPDAKFELVRDIDLQGAELFPVGSQSAPFTGELNGANFTVSNFTLKTSQEGDLGFFGVLQGKVRNLNLKDMTLVADENTRQIGAMAGVTSGSISRCSASGSITVAQAAEQSSCGAAAGVVNGGEILYSNFAMDIAFDAPGQAYVGGMAGQILGGVVNDNDTTGKLDVTKGSNKTVGLLAGKLSNAQMNGCAFVGASNTVDGQLYEEFNGEQENAEMSRCLRRDNSAEPLPENVQALRDKVEANMRAQGTIQWRVSEVLYHDCSCALAVCHGAFYPEKIYQGIPYNHKAGSLDRFQYCFDENGVAQDWIYDTLAFEGHDMYMGNDCSTSIQKAWLTVSNSITFTGAAQEIPDRHMGTIPVGDWTWDLGKIPWYSIDYIEATDEQVMYEAYAQLRKGDAISYVIEEGGHTRMCAADAVVVRDAEGKIDPTYSYALFHEQGAPVTWEPYYSTWRIDYKYTFANLYMATAVPLTMEELLTGEMETPEATLEGGCEGKAGLTTGVVKANYAVDSVTMVITDEAGQEVLNHRLFTAVGKHEDHSNNSVFIRKVTMEYDMANFALPLRDLILEPSRTYRCTVTANLATGDSFVVKDYTF